MSTVSFASVKYDLKAKQQTALSSEISIHISMTLGKFQSIFNNAHGG